MSSKSAKKDELDVLKNYSNKFEEEFKAIKIKLLKSICSSSFNDAKQMTKYEEILLFMAAYPDSAESLQIVISELKRLNQISSTILKGASATRQNAFSGSGFQSSYFIGSFSHTISSWLAKEYPECSTFDSYGDSERLPQEILALSLLPSETWLNESLDLHINKWTKYASGYNQKEILSWLLKSMEHPGLPVSILDLLFDSLQLFISFEIKEANNSKALLRAPKGKYFFVENKLIKSINIEEELKKNKLKPLKLSQAEAKEYLRVARFALLHLSRETDPITYCHHNGIECFELERGFSIALFYLPVERRNATDSYIGYMMFKNRIPCAYGGAWIFGNKAKIGLNIFSPFRGGESAFLFAQVIGLYKKRFKVRYFEAEPYQIGSGNPEGIASGAFWFYYKLGFRPVQQNFNALAKEEFEKISSDKSYRTSRKNLKQLAHSFLFLDTQSPGEELKTFLPDSLNISRVISQIIRDRFKGNREKAMNFFEKEVKIRTGIKSDNFKLPDEKNMLLALLPLVFILSQKTKISKQNISLLEELVRTKTESTEYNYTQSTRRIQKWLSKIIHEIRVV